MKRGINMKVGIKLSKFMLIILSVIILFWILWHFLDASPRIKNFKEQQPKYENIVSFLLDEMKLSGDNLIISIRENYTTLTMDGEPINMPDDVANDLEYICLNNYKYVTGGYAAIRITQTSVAFAHDETGFYTVIYTTNPIKDVYFTEHNLPFQWLKSDLNWYEVGSTFLR